MSSAPSGVKLRLRGARDVTARGTMRRRLRHDGREWPIVDVDLVVTSGSDPELFEAFAGVVERGEGFPQLPPLRRAEHDAMWGHASVVVAARAPSGTSGSDRLVGAYYLKPNGPGLNAHVANAGYFVVPEHRGRGVGRLLVVDSIQRAPSAGFDAIQFNFVFERNPARRLYESLGWQVVGRIPRALPDQDALIYWRAV